MSLKEKIKRLERQAKHNAHFGDANVKNNLVDMVARDDLKIEIDFEAVDKKYNISGGDDTAATAAKAPPAAAKKKKKEIAIQHTGPFLPAPDGTPKPGASLKVQPLGALDFPFHDLYKLGKVLNSGAFGTVHIGHHVMTGPKGPVAIKVVDRQRHNCDVDDDEILRETEVMRTLSEFDHIVRLFDFYMDDEKFYIVQELAAGGDVFDRLEERESYSESDARDLCGILFETMGSVHAKHMVHRDLKPENLLLKNAKSDISILLCDFGFTKTIPNNGKGQLRTQCGTPSYISPEMINGVGYAYDADMWSIGCIVYMLLCGQQPFAGIDDEMLMFESIAAGDWAFGYDDEEIELWKKVSPEAKDLIKMLLNLDSKKRFTAYEALQSSWFTDCKKFKLKKTRLEAVTVKNIKIFNKTIKKPKFAYLDKTYTGDADCLYVGPTKEELARLKKLAAIAMYRPNGTHLND